ncbi:unnamed protein product (macronuclear) [Paramecium tetraurelia]|uniref:Uncharacterized protein n=1 Tax=Paramecium tetraurelia TaxID=5888 RepID=A0CX55_PARTE|nr:uncharacterized protein GSPATT00001576001 [Paramecium tetraurelia]CAK75372.1 unnamed protein product [Paramecium tetraurelia]|eukprot:XP_001442769.1 hypothetical protein (macronuclear) [Paramecium tetraurelia strain d4-2]
MITYSPNFKLNPMTPLSVHHKLSLIEDEPDDLDLEQGYSKIQFNEKLIVCMYKPNQNVTNIQKTLLKLKGQQNIGWVNPILNDEKVRSSSILKSSQSPIRICSVSQ